jgi:hypothetical protein
VVGVALFIKFEEAEGEIEMAFEADAGAAVEARLAGSGYKANAAALEPATRTLSTRRGSASRTSALSPASARASASSTACKCFIK